jgi:hypothetical protein
MLHRQRAICTYGNAQSPLGPNSLRQRQTALFVRDSTGAAEGVFRCVCRPIAQGDSQVFMKNKVAPSFVLSAVIAWAFVPGELSAQPVIVNPSFEVDGTPAYPGYSTITGWTPGGTISTGYGINEGGGPFADNGAVPHGTRVAFMQDNGTLSQTVSGFVVGEQYWLVYRENARGLCCGERVATLSATVGGTTVVSEHEVTIVGASAPYRFVTSAPFIAAETEMTLTFAKGGVGDSTALIDDVRMVSRDSLRLGIDLREGSLPVIRIQGIPGRMVTLEFKNALLPETSWQMLLNVLVTNGLEFVDSNAPASHPRFYRAWQVP